MPVKELDLLENTQRRESMLVAYSGGVDSTLLAVVARDALGTKSRCVLLDSPLVPRAAVEEAGRLARELGLTLDIMPVPLMAHDEFCNNTKARCYNCKKIMAVLLRNHARDFGLACIADGVNISDSREYRPGIQASDEEGILHPFIETGCTKQDIRDIARGRGLPVWQKPSAACLASRIPYGERITGEKLRTIEQAEAFLTDRGFSQLRVRLHGSIARIEVYKEDMGRILDEKESLSEYLRSLGVAYVTLDLAGYRSGSMDEVLK